MKNKTFDLQELIAISQEARQARKTAEKQLSHLQEVEVADPVAVKTVKKAKDPTSMSKDLQYDLKKSEVAQQAMSTSDKRNLRAMIKKIEDATGVSQFEDVL